MKAFREQSRRQCEAGLAAMNNQALVLDQSDNLCLQIWMAG
jgi:hypothetical protein